MIPNALSKMKLARYLVSSFFVCLCSCKHYASSEASAEAPQFATSNNSHNAIRQLAQSAPYALDDGTNQPGGGASGSKNIVFRLSMDQERTWTDENPWQLGAENSSSLQAASRLQMNLKKLLDTLNSSHLSSEVKFDDQNGGALNVTIISPPNRTDHVDQATLRDLIMEANSMTWLNGSQVVKDNHKFEPRHPPRSRPINVEINTPPPIRRIVDVVAENYTMRKVADEANVFAFKLINQLNIENLGTQNLITSPFTVYQGLALLLMGAMGDTAKELDRVLLGSSSAYENTKLTHDQDRHRLLASLSDTIRQLHFSSTHHLRTLSSSTSTNNEQDLLERLSNELHESGGSLDQHLIVANNLLFAPQAYEVSNEFKNYINTYYNHTVLSRVETDSTESIQMVNSWIRRVTSGIIPSIIDKKSVFDEYHVLALLCTSWLAQEWRDNFKRITSNLRSSIRLKGQGRAISSFFIHGRDESLLEFVDDFKQSHFVEFIRSEPTKNIHHYQAQLGFQLVDIVSVPFLDSNHRFIALSPFAAAQPQSPAQAKATVDFQSLNEDVVINSTAGTITEPSDASPLSKLMAMFAASPRKMLRNFWNIIAPDIITKNTLKTVQLTRLKNITLEDHIIETSIPPLVQLSMPLIRTEADSSISAALNHMGVVNSFDPSQANFIGINGHPFNYNKLHLSNVLSKTSFKTDERGINYDKTIKTLEALRVYPYKTQERVTMEAAAAAASKKGVKLGVKDEPVRWEIIDDVKLNRPFMYLVCDTKTKLILYMGAVRNPNQEST